MEQVQKTYKRVLYDKSNKFSILEYSKNLLGKTLAEAIYPDTIYEGYSGKGRLGQMVEKYYFGYEVNSLQEADFAEAHIELKCTPLKKLKDKTLAIKERLVCTMIDYSDVYKKDFNESHIYLKCAEMLILFYLHQSGVPVEHLKFIYSVLWQIPEKDLLIIEQDYKTIVNKVREGRAHELSEGDTTYLGACRKGQKGDSDQMYFLPNGEKAKIAAPKRAFSLKPAYMRTILEFAKQSKSGCSYNTSSLCKGYGKSELISEAELKAKSFEDILLDRFKPYYGKTYEELCHELNLGTSTAKSKYALIANAILTENQTRGEDIKKSEEWLKSGIRLKTIRIQASGRPKEAMSFENINYQEILQEEEWTDSRLYELFTSRFFFVVFKEIEGEYRLEKAFFWTMPYQDLADAAIYWKDVQKNVEENHIDSHYFYREGQHKKFHVRPKAKDSSDVAINPHGGSAPKYCYWFNHDYVQDIVNKN